VKLARNAGIVAIYWRRDDAARPGEADESAISPAFLAGVAWCASTFGLPLQWRLRAISAAGRRSAAHQYGSATQLAMGKCVDCRCFLRNIKNWLPIGFLPLRMRLNGRTEQAAA
jgi:hypothetical protein